MDKTSWTCSISMKILGIPFINIAKINTKKMLRDVGKILRLCIYVLRVGLVIRLRPANFYRISMHKTTLNIR